MRISTSLLLGGLFAPALCATANCSSNLQIFVARGTGEMSGTGKMGLTAMTVAAVVPNVNITPVLYPAVAFDYFESVHNGTTLVMKMIKEYVDQCPAGRVVLMGYSQGGQAIMDALCGTSSRGFQEQAGLQGSYVDNIVAAIIFGDPSHQANVTYDYGSSIRNGLFPRTNEAGCTPYAPKIRSYCDQGDVFCDTGSNRTTHSLYVEAYTENVAEFVLEKVKLSNSTSGTGSGTSGTTPSATSATPSPTQTKTNDAAGMGAGNVLYAVVGFVALLNGLQS